MVLLQGAALHTLARIGQQAMFHGRIIDRERSIFEFEIMGVKFQYFESRSEKKVRGTKMPIIERHIRGANWSVKVISPTSTTSAYDWEPNTFTKQLMTPEYDQYQWGERFFTVVDGLFTGDETSFEHDLIIAQMIGSQTDDWADQIQNLEG